MILLYALLESIDLLLRIGLGNNGIYCHDIRIMAKNIMALLYITIFYFFLSLRPIIQ